jgi:hypothetical protein
VQLVFSSIPPIVNTLGSDSVRNSCVVRSSRRNKRGNSTGFAASTSGFFHIAFSAWSSPDRLMNDEWVTTLHSTDLLRFISFGWQRRAGMSIRLEKAASANDYPWVIEYPVDKQVEDKQIIPCKY